MKDVEAVILAGGKGTRLRPYTVSIPKPLVPLGDEPIIEILLQQLEACGIRRVHLALGHLANLIKAYLEQTGTQRPLEILYSFESKALGTVGPVKQIPLTSDTFLVLNGDLLTTMSFADLIATHRRRGCIATLAVHTRQVVMDYGIVEVSPDARIVGHREKPSLDVKVGMGVYAFERRVLDHIPNDQKFDIPDLIQTLLRAGEPLAAYESDDYWMDIGRPDDYEIAYRDYTTSPERFLPRRHRSQP
jgi:NDP-sugar pyrophosphorylase family protein